MLFSPAPPQNRTLPPFSAPSWCSPSALALPLISCPRLSSSVHLHPALPVSLPLSSAMAAPEEGLEPLRYQTLALKVRIHCEGCKKKVKKVLHSIEGVYKTDIDMQQQKVVVIGNVSADTLVKKLLKTGKHAEPWPEPAAPPPPADGAPGGSPGSGGGGGGGAKKKKKKSKSKNAGNSKPAEPAPAPADGGGGGAPIPPDNAGACDEASEGEHDKPEGGGGGPPGAGDAHDGGAMTPHGAQPVPPAGNGNGGGKRKGKKVGSGGGHGNANANGDGAAGAIVEVHPPDGPTKPAGGPITVIDAGPYPPPPPAMSYPGYYGGGGGHSPAYVMSYHTAHPSPALRSSAYYHPMVGAAYTTGGGGGGYFYSTAPASAPPGSYYMFSEENANACTVM